MNRLLEYCSLQKVSLLVVLLSMSFLEVSAFVDSTGLAGDHFSLEGALELFKKAKSPEAFEKLLNQEDQSINNLDLNEDNQVDYIRVIDHMKDNVHALVLQVPLNENESQDIAVIEIEKTGRESAILQIIGDPDVYGEEIIVEPFEEEGQGGKGGPDIEEMRVARVVVNVWFWPSVRFVFAPGYRVWVSPWRWARYPTWYRPWRPLAWRVYQPRTVVYRSRFHVVSTHRVVRAHRIYTPVRIYSPTVKSRTTRVVKTNGHKNRSNKTYNYQRCRSYWKQSGYKKEYQYDHLQ